MAATVFPLPVTTISEKTFTTTVPSSATPYVATVSMSPGVYRITCVSSTITTVGFFSGNTLIATALTASGTVDVTVASAVTRLSITTNTGSNIAVTVTFQSAPIVISGVSGTLTTITSSGTYTTQGIAFAVAVGGGGGGGQSGAQGSGGGGGSGGVASGLVGGNGNITVTIGAGGEPTLGGGTTTIGTLTATGGGAGQSNASAAGGTGGTAGSPGGGVGGAGSHGGSNNATAGAASAAPDYTFVKTGTTGAGGGGGYSAVANGGTGGGSGGIGTGGTGSGTQNSNTATSGTGYGAGGGGGSRIINNAAGSGSQGVVYLIGGF